MQGGKVKMVAGPGCEAEQIRREVFHLNMVSQLLVDAYWAMVGMFPERQLSRHGSYRINRSSKRHRARCG